MDGECRASGEINSYKPLLGGPRYRWEDNITGLKDLGFRGMDWIFLAEGIDQSWNPVDMVISFNVS